MVKNEVHPMCKEQKQLIQMLDKILEEEKDNLYINEAKADKYLSYEKYFPFKLFAWEKFLLVVVIMTLLFPYIF